MANLLGAFYAEMAGPLKPALKPRFLSGEVRGGTLFTCSKAHLRLRSTLNANSEARVRTNVFQDPFSERTVLVFNRRATVSRKSQIQSPNPDLKSCCQSV